MPVGMRLTCSDSSGRPITTGTLIASGQIRTFGGTEVSAIDHTAAVSVTTGQWLVVETDAATLSDFTMTLSMAGAHDDTGAVIGFQSLFGVPYTDGESASVRFTPIPVTMPGAVADPLSWSQMDGRELPDGDRIVASTYPLGGHDPLFILESGPEVAWWKSIDLFSPSRNAASLLCKTTGPGQTSLSAAFAVPAGPYHGPSIDIPFPGGGVVHLPLYGLSEWDVLNSNRLIFHKPKFLGTDTAIYSLEMSQAPHGVFERVGWRFKWDRQ